MNVIMVWAWILWIAYAWMLWLAYAVVTERYYGLGMDALVSVCSRKWTFFVLGIDALVSVCCRK